MDPFTLFAAALAAGVVSSSTSSELDRKRTVLRFRRVPRNFTTSPYRFVRGYSLKTEDPRDSDGIWHVTTGLRAVLREGLLPRSRTGKIGLGGGPMHQAPDQISAVTQHAAAVRVYEAMRLAIGAARNQVCMADIVKGFLRTNHVPIDRVLEHEEWLAEAEELGPQEGLGLDLAGTLGLDRDSTVSLFEVDLDDPFIRKELDERYPKGQDKYEIFHDLEMDLLGWLERRQSTLAESEPCLDIVGFTAPWSRFVQISPDDVAILQLAVHRNAVVDHVPSECELRFSPEDVVVVGWERPADQDPRR